MAIDALNNRSLDGLKEPDATAKPAAPKASVLTGEKVSTAEVAEKATDAVMLTDTAKTLAKATNKAKESSGIDEAKVEKIKAAIQDGSYKINYESVANKLIDSEDELSSIFG